MLKAKVMKSAELSNPAFSNNLTCVTHHQSGLYKSKTLYYTFTFSSDTVTGIQLQKTPGDVKVRVTPGKDCQNTEVFNLMIAGPSVTKTWC